MCPACLQGLLGEASRCKPFPAAQPFLFYPHSYLFSFHLRRANFLRLPQLLAGDWPPSAPWPSRLVRMWSALQLHWRPSQPVTCQACGADDHSWKSAEVRSQLEGGLRSMGAEQGAAVLRRYRWVWCPSQCMSRLCPPRSDLQRRRPPLCGLPRAALGHFQARQSGPLLPCILPQYQAVMICTHHRHATWSDPCPPPCASGGTLPMKSCTRMWRASWRSSVS